MTFSERHKRLAALEVTMFDAFRLDFVKWQASVSALLSYDPRLQVQFDHHAMGVMNDRPFSNILGEPHQSLQIVLSRAIADTEVKAVSECEPKAPSHVQRQKGQTIVTPPVSPVLSIPLEGRNLPTRLTQEEGALWFWTHCHYRVRWVLIMTMIPITITLFMAGFTAGRTNLFVKLFDVLKDPSNSALDAQQNQAPAVPLINTKNDAKNK